MVGVSQASKFGAYKKCCTERGISVAMRTGDRHEVSEKVGIRKAGMPNSESSDGNFVAARGQIGRRPGKGIFDLGENIRMLNSSKIKPGEANKFVDEEEEIGVILMEKFIFSIRNFSTFPLVLQFILIPPSLSLSLFNSM